MGQTSTYGEVSPLNGARAVTRALELLREIGNQPTPMRVSDVARMCGVGTSTASRLLRALADVGFVQKDPASGQYEIGEECLSLAGAVLNRSTLYSAAAPVAFDLAARAGLGVNVAKRSGDTAIYLLSYPGQRVSGTLALIGRRIPLHATAIGKALLSGMRLEEVAAIAERTGLPPHTPHTITEAEALTKNLEQIRRRGYALEVEEFSLGRACISAPIRSGSGEAVAALSMSGPKSLLAIAERESELADMVLEAVDRIGPSA